MSDDEPAPAVDTSASPTASDDAAGSGRGWKIAAIAAVVAALASIGVLGALLFTGGSSKVGDDVRACIIDPASRDFTAKGKESGHAKPANCPPKGSIKTDGLVDKTSKGGFSLRRIEAGKLGEKVTLHVREPDRPYIDIAHAQTHAALGQPIRVYTLEIDGRQSVVYMEDAPLLK